MSNIEMIFENTFLILFLFCTHHISGAQVRSPVTWTYTVTEDESTQVGLALIAHVAEGWHIYSQHNRFNGPPPTRLIFQPNENFRLLSTTSEEGDCADSYNEIFDDNVRSCINTIEFRQSIEILKRPCEIQIRIEYMACGDDMCIPEQKLLTIDIK